LLYAISELPHNSKKLRIRIIRRIFMGQAGGGLREIAN
jgi:hypothetical protein